MKSMYHTMDLLVLIFILFIKSNWSFEVESMAGVLGGNDNLKKTKRHDDIGYLEQCGVLHAWPEKSERVQVLAFLDASWSPSHTQAAMLKQLKDRLERSNISGIDFFAINAAFAIAPSTEKSPFENSEWDDIAAAAQVKKQEMSIYEALTENIVTLIQPDIKFIQDTPELQIWDKLKVSRNQILVIDQCGRLTYQVIVPWSILQFPYVKAAILSTYMDQPCGPCDVVSSSTVGADLVEGTTVDDTNSHRIYMLNENPSSLEDNQNASKSTMKVLNDNTTDEKIMNDSTIEKQSTTQYSINEMLLTTVLPTGSFETENSEFTDNKSMDMTTTISSTVDYPEAKIKYDTTTEYYVSKTTKVYTEHFNVTNNDVKNVTESTAFTEIVDGNIKTVANSHSIYDDTDNLEQRIRTDPMNIVVPFKMDDMGNVYGDEARNQESSQESQVSRTSVQPEEEGIVDTENESFGIPIRIIMYAPHLHEDDHSIRRHEYLVLKTGQPDYHEHLSSGKTIKNADDLKDFPNAGINMENPIDNDTKESLYKIDDNGEQSKGIELSKESIEEQHRKHHEKGQKLSRLLFGKDESPGFYGEDADYWRNYGSEQSYERIEIIRPNDDHEYLKVKDDLETTKQDFEHFWTQDEYSPERTDPQHEFLEENINQSNSNEWINTSEQIVPYQENIKGSAEQNNEDKKITIDNTDQSHDINSSEDEIRNKLIAHYSKLFPWINYVLNK
ncbi:uncharacterized protein LOC107264735 isoform X2 [Cephus cinctus]|uniref:Uncharacterized protein LOC107264735 isoform X2 n=1 Tax=Cephus cinctus TaxID=211228 RepID=A0AAJ7RBC0_CEPCN|nr:uncharacterized protein LOC107264735 isoform X2 [Cephus cinctus]